MNQIEQYVIGAAIGFASAHALSLLLKFTPAIIGYLVNALLRIPSVMAYVKANPAQIKAILEVAEKEIEKDIDAIAPPAAQ